MAWHEFVREAHFFADAALKFFGIDAVYIFKAIPFKVDNRRYAQFGSQDSRAMVVGRFYFGDKFVADSFARFGKRIFSQKRRLKSAAFVYLRKDFVVFGVAACAAYRWVNAFRE